MIRALLCLGLLGCSSSSTTESRPTESQTIGSTQLSFPPALQNALGEDARQLVLITEGRFHPRTSKTTKMFFAGQLVTSVPAKAERPWIVVFEDGSPFALEALFETLCAAAKAGWRNVALLAVVDGEVFRPMERFDPIESQHEKLAVYLTAKRTWIIDVDAKELYEIPPIDNRIDADKIEYEIKRLVAEKAFASLQIAVDPDVHMLDLVFALAATTKGIQRVAFVTPKQLTVKPAS